MNQLNMLGCTELHPLESIMHVNQLAAQEGPPVSYAGGCMDYISRQAVMAEQQGE